MFASVWRYFRVGFVYNLHYNNIHAYQPTQYCTALRQTELSYITLYSDGDGQTMYGTFSIFTNKIEISMAHTL